MKDKRFLATWALIALAGLLVGLAAGDGVRSATPEIPTIDYLRFDCNDAGQFVVHWAGQFNPGKPGTFTLTGGTPGPLVCRHILGETDCDCRIDEDKDGFRIDCYFDSAMPFKLINRPCQCLVGLWWEDDAGFHWLGNCTGRCLQCVFLPIVGK